MVHAQTYNIDDGWKCMRASEAGHTGEEISSSGFSLDHWFDAVVPGTVLTSQLHNRQIPDPFYGMNDRLVADIYDSGMAYYTWWFVRDIAISNAPSGGHDLLELRGVNSTCDIYVNGRLLRKDKRRSMYLRREYDITALLSPQGSSRIAILVHPPDPPGNPNGGQGGDGMIAHTITNQYTAGWDWIQPVGDRNTGIWDKVSLRQTGPVELRHTHVITLVPGIRKASGRQQPATLRVSAELANTGSTEVEGKITYKWEHGSASMPVRMKARSRQTITFPDEVVQDPGLWWPNGYGAQQLHNLSVRFVTGNESVSDHEDLTFGIRQLHARWNAHTQSRELYVNGRRIFLKGGNRIVTDAMLRASPARYDAEVRYHRDMNLNLIRVWGGGITERPEFYDACDKYGLLVLQDFWVSGDCNGRWYDPMKREDSNTRKKYPDDHRLLIETLADQVMMLRNHPSLAFWCGGNEITPPTDVLASLRDSILPILDGTRFFFSFSNDDSMSLHSSDGPYTIQPVDTFWVHRSFPFNSEVGSVGIGDLESVKRFIPTANLVPPFYDTLTRGWVVDSVWKYHKYIGYDSSVEVYGHPGDLAAFISRAQLVNYNQYRALAEGFTSHAWDWYSGFIIWKTQNPWTAMLGQMYDVYLDPNACLFGLREGAKPLHIMYDPVHNGIRIANLAGAFVANLKWSATVYDFTGHAIVIDSSAVAVIPDSLSALHPLSRGADALADGGGCILLLRLRDAATGAQVDENGYWLPATDGSHSGLQHMAAAKVTVTRKLVSKGEMDVTISNPRGQPVAFFIRLSLVNVAAGTQVLPVFSDNNYISVPPGERRTVRMSYNPAGNAIPGVSVRGWNVKEMVIK